MQEYDALTIWEASDVDGSWAWWKKQPARSPFQMGIGVWYIAHMNAHRYHNRKQEQQAEAGKSSARMTKYDKN